MTYEELVEQIAALPAALARGQDPSGEGDAEDGAAPAFAEIEVAAMIARAAQDSLKMRVEIARGRGATWTMIGNAIGITPFRAEQRYLERRPFGARW